MVYITLKQFSSEISIKQPGKDFLILTNHMWKFNIAYCHSHENGNLITAFMGILDSRSTDCGNDRGRLCCLFLS